MNDLVFFQNVPKFAENSENQLFIVKIWLMGGGVGGIGEIS